MPWHPATGHGSWGSPSARSTAPSPCSSRTVGGGFFLRCSGLTTVSLLCARNKGGDLSRIYTAPDRFLLILGEIGRPVAKHFGAKSVKLHSLKAFAVNNERYRGARPARGLTPLTRDGACCGCGHARERAGRRRGAARRSSARPRFAGRGPAPRGSADSRAVRPTLPPRAP